MASKFDGIRGKAADLLDSASASAKETAEAARRRVNSTYGNARDTSERLMEQGRERAAGAYETGCDRAEQAYRSGKEKAGRAYEVGKDRASHAYGVSKVQAGKVADKTVEQINDKPLAAVVGAFAIGAIAALLVPKGGKRDA